MFDPAKYIIAKKVFKLGIESWHLKTRLVSKVWHLNLDCECLKNKKEKGIFPKVVTFLQFLQM